MNDVIDLGYWIGALRRRWWVIALPAAVGTLLAVGVAYLLPPVFVSSARIVVESQQIPSELARSTVAMDATQRIRLIEERLTTRRNLLDLAQRYDVFANRGELSSTEIVNRMRQATTIRPVSASNRRGNRTDTMITTVEIAFRASRSSTAAQVANEFLTQVLAANTQQRSARASETLDFFTREVERLSAELRAIERRIGAFKTENQMSLPESIEYRRTELASLQREIYAADSRKLALVETKRAVEAALELGRPIGATMTQEQTDIARLRSQLVAQSAIYAPSHPEIRALTARLAALEAASAATAAAEGGETDGEAGGGEADGGGDGLAGVDDAIAPELARIEAEIRLIDQQQEAQKSRIAELEEAVAKSGEVGIGLGALERELSSLQIQYQQAVLKQADAATGERLEVNQQAERFEVIEQPQAPEQPISPNRPLIAAAGAVVSLGFGFALAALLELLNPALRTARDMERRIGQRPIVAIPYIRTLAEQRRRRWALRGGVFAAAVVLPATLWVVDRQVIPLSLVAERLIERAGIEEAIEIARDRLDR